jgi:hypothetical protein
MKPPTDLEMREMLAFVQAGGLPEIAASAAGVEEKRFHFWKVQCKKSTCPKPIRQLFQKLQQAHGQAVLRAQITAFNEKPLDWLKNTGKQKGEATPADDLSWNQLLPAILRVLEPFPEARQALAKVFGRH